jgi:hypothetical protein
MFKFETAWPQLWDNLLFHSLAMDTFQKDARSIGNAARRENNTHKPYPLGSVKFIKS